jgi:hypothetical protein
MNGTTRNILIGIGALVVVGGIGYGAYTLFFKGGDATVDFQGQTLQSADICNATLAYASAIGVVPFDATLQAETTTKGDAENRVVCSIAGGGREYEASTDLRCTDMANPKCTDLYKVTDSKDVVLFQRAS